MPIEYVGSPLKSPEAAAFIRLRRTSALRLTLHLLGHYHSHVRYHEHVTCGMEWPAIAGLEVV